jgi:hypothetical protein
MPSIDLKLEGDDRRPDPGPAMASYREMISPGDIHIVRGSLWDCFGECMREISAAFVVRLCRSKGGWFPFTKAELDAMDAAGSFCWNGLDRPEWIYDLGDGRYSVTNEFVRVAARSKPAPAEREVPR